MMDRVEILVQDWSYDPAEHSEVLKYGFVGEASLAISPARGLHLEDEGLGLRIVDGS